MILTTNGRQKQPSFSLIELLICISIMLILASLSIARFFDLDHALLKNELDTLFITFSYLQQKAIASNKHQTIQFELATNTFTYIGHTGTLCTQKLAPSTKFGFLTGTKGPPSAPTKLIEKPITFEHHKQAPQATCLPDGKITPGTIYLVNKKETEMVALTCPITHVSYVRKYRYSMHKWVGI